MNILNFFNITKMTNEFFKFKNYLELLSSGERLREINFLINEFNRFNRNSENISEKILHIERTKNIKKRNND